MDAVTPREQQVYNAVMAAGGKGQLAMDVAGKALGISAATARRAFTNAKRKGAIAGGKAEVKAAKGPVARAPAKGADLLDAASEPALELPGKDGEVLRIHQLAAKHRIPESTVRTLLAQVRSRYSPLLSQIKNVKSDLVRDLFATRTVDILESITSGDLADATLRDKMAAADLAAKNWMLLDGRPTAIVRNDADRGAMVRLLAGVTLELQRRALPAPVLAPEVIEINPRPAEVPAERPSA